MRDLQWPILSEHIAHPGCMLSRAIGYLNDRGVSTFLMQYFMGVQRNGAVLGQI